MSETTGAEGHVHRYHATCHWAGDAAIGYECYDRAHTCSAPPASTELMLSADPAFLGHREKLNPEQLVGGGGVFLSTVVIFGYRGPRKGADSGGCMRCSSGRRAGAKTLR